ncbi:MAG TPA: four helix bundle protein [Steroidobacteraceae bacterium]|nr:four helix bundle protein [Steroidobacteraceae bacterium]
MAGLHATNKDLVVWQKAIALALCIYRSSERFPRNELFGLTSQLRRAAVSIPSNIAEGAARRTTREFLMFLHVARGSLAEVETQILLARQLGYLDERQRADLEMLVIEVGRLINSFIVGLRRRRESAPTNR